MDQINTNWRAEFHQLEGAYSPATMRSYRADIEVFEAWCAEEALCAFPAEVSTLCQFLEAQGRLRVANTVQRRLYAIRKVHRLLRLPDPTMDEAIHLALRKVRRAQTARPKQASALTSDLLDQFVASQPETLIGLRNQAMLALGYELLTRRSELVTLRDHDLTERPDGTFRVMIRKSKADPYGKGRTAFTSRTTADLIRKWQEARGNDVDWLFCPISRGAPVNRSLNSVLVSRLMKLSARRAGFSISAARDFSGHSMRVGAAQDLLCRGLDTAAIMRAGGWKSVSVLARYLQDAQHNVWA
jgi:site-specific recombinase XerD